MGTFQQSSVVDAQTNVILVKSILTEDNWNQSFPYASSVYTYANFMRAVAKFPMFCNEVPSASAEILSDICKRELATLLAHIKYESGALQAVADPECSDPYQQVTACDKKWESLTYPPYYG